MANKKIDFGSVGMALSCTLFLERALLKYQDYTKFIDNNTIDIIHEWNNVLLDNLKAAKYDSALGKTGKKLVQYASENPNFVTRCMTGAKDVTTQSLHYVLRFDETVGFLRNKYKNNQNLTFCDLGVGLSPLPIVFQMQYNIKNVYCIDIVPEIIDIYKKAANQCNVGVPNFINWETLKNMAEHHEINTIVSVGCLPHMSKEMQKEYLQIINAKFNNFFVEIKFVTNKKSIEVNSNAFCLSDLQKLRLDISDVTDIEQEIIRNALSYLHRFIKAKPNRVDFISDYRSLFLSR